MLSRRVGLAILYLFLVGVPATGQFQSPMTIGVPSPEAGARFGDVLATGDVNGDGAVDLLVGAPLADATTTNGTVTDAGRVYVFLGPDFTLGPAQTLQGDPAETSAHFGAVVVTAQVNDDSFDDIIVGAPGANATAGRVYVFLGSESLDGTAEISLEAPTPQQGAHFGGSVAIGDFGDVGEESTNSVDIVVGANEADVIMTMDDTETATVDAGQAYVFFGPDFSGEPQTLQAGTPEAGARFGTAVVAGDLNNDMIDDIVVAADRTNGMAMGDAQPNAGDVSVFFGGMMFDTTSDVSLLAVDVQGGAAFGRAMTVADVSGDGIDDVIVGTPLFDISGSLPDVGQMVVFQGAEGLSGTPTADATIRGPLSSFAYFGGSLASGDVNGDGLNDIVAGAPGLEVAGKASAGGAFILVNGAPLSGTLNTNIALRAPNPAPDTCFGDAVAAADLDHNGVADLIVGAPCASVGDVPSAGRVYIFLSRAPTTPSIVDQSR